MSRVPYKIGLTPTFVPVMDQDDPGVIGSAREIALRDHAHPHDTNRAAQASPSITDGGDFFGGTGSLPVTFHTRCEFNGDANFNNPIDVGTTSTFHGAATFNGNATFNNPVDINGPLSVGQITGSGGITLSGGATIGGTLNHQGGSVGFYGSGTVGQQARPSTQAGIINVLANLGLTT